MNFRKRTSKSNLNFTDIKLGIHRPLNFVLILKIKFEYSNFSKENYQSCSCIDNEIQSVLVASSAKDGFCPSDCKILIPFLIILFFLTLFTSINQMPMIMVTLRSVTDIERPFALGLQLVIMRLLGIR